MHLVSVQLCFVCVSLKCRCVHTIDLGCGQLACSCAPARRQENVVQRSSLHFFFNANEKSRVKVKEKIVWMHSYQKKRVSGHRAPRSLFCINLSSVMTTHSLCKSKKFPQTEGKLRPLLSVTAR